MGSTHTKAYFWQVLIPVCIALCHLRSLCFSQALGLSQTPWKMGRVLVPASHRETFCSGSQVRYQASSIVPKGRGKCYAGSRAQGWWGPQSLLTCRRIQTYAPRAGADFTSSPSPLCSGSFFAQPSAYWYPSPKHSPHLHLYSIFSPLLSRMAIILHIFLSEIYEYNSILFWWLILALMLLSCLHN